jgi:transposase
MDKQYRPWLPGQPFLLPPSPLDWLPPEHLVHFLFDVLESLDLSEITGAIHAKDARGTRPYHPRMMTALLLYGYCVGLASSRKLEAATYTDVAFRVLAGDCHPDHSAIATFRRTHLTALAKFFLQVLRLCQQAGLVTLGHVALDGTKVQANASKHKAMSYERMLKTEAELTAEIERLLAAAETVDQEEDARYGKDRRGDELPEELRRRETRLQKIRAAKAALEAEAAAARAREVEEQAERARQKAAATAEEERAAAERTAQKATERAAAAQQQAQAAADARVAAARAAAETQRAAAQTPAERRRATAAEDEQRRAEEAAAQVAAGAANAAPPTWPTHQVPADAEGHPKPEAQRNFTDGDSRIMKRGSEYLQGYNGQAAVDEEHQIIVGQGLSNQAPDVEHLSPMLDEIERNCGRLPARLTGDSGYFSEENARTCEERGVDAHLAVERQKHGADPAAPPPAPEGEGKRAMRAKLQTPAGRATYARRKAVVEPVFGQIKEARGFRRFLLRGLKRVRSEWALICTGHNLRKLLAALRDARVGAALPAASSA